MYHEILFAMCGIRILAIVGIVAIVAFAVKSRAVFVAGSLGGLLGYVMPERREYAEGTAEALFMYGLESSADHIWWCGICGSILAIVMTKMWLRHQSRLFPEALDGV